MRVYRRGSAEYRARPSATFRASITASTSNCAQSVSGKAGHKEEFLFCHETRQPMMPEEAEQCEVTGKFVRPGVLESCRADRKGRLALRARALRRQREASAEEASGDQQRLGRASAASSGGALHRRQILRAGRSEDLHVERAPLPPGRSACLQPDGNSVSRRVRGPRRQALSSAARRSAAWGAPHRRCARRWEDIA